MADPGVAPNHEPLRTVSAVEALTVALREAIIDGELAPGERLREQALAERYGVARHTLRAGLRALAADGLVRIERNRGASVATLAAGQLVELFELRGALEVEAARLALERGDGRLAPEVHVATAHLAAVARRRGARWAEVGEAHDALHHAIVVAARSPRILAAHEALAGELALFVTQIQPAWSGRRMAAEHEALVADLERRGPEALREHIAEGLHTLVPDAPT